MSTTDIAKRVHDHNWKLDPIIRSLLDTDIYKFLMQQLIWKRYRDVDVTFSLINRANRIRLADDIDEDELRAQLDYARSLKLGNKEWIWLAGNTFYGKRQIFARDADAILVTNSDPKDNIVVMSASDYDSLMETLHIYENPYLMDKVQRGLAQVKSRQTIRHDLIEQEGK